LVKIYGIDNPEIIKHDTTTPGAFWYYFNFKTVNLNFFSLWSVHE